MSEKVSFITIPEKGETYYKGVSVAIWGEQRTFKLSENYERNNGEACRLDI